MIKEINLKDNEERYNEIKKKLLNNIYTMMIVFGY